VGYVDLNSVSLILADGRVLLDEITFRVGEGRKAALLGANGAGKTTLLRVILAMGTGPGRPRRWPAGHSIVTSWRVRPAVLRHAFLEVSRPASRSCCWNCPELTCCCLMSPLTTSIWSPRRRCRTP